MPPLEVFTEQIVDPSLLVKGDWFRVGKSRYEVIRVNSRMLWYAHYDATGRRTEDSKVELRYVTPRAYGMPPLIKEMWLTNNI